MAAAEAYGIFADSVGIAEVISSLVPNSSDKNDAKVGIQVGQAGDSASTEGTIDSIFAYDTGNGYQGVSDSFDVGNGAFIEVTIDTSTNGVELGYIDVVGTDDATCIAWAIVHNPNSIQSAWTGDYGKECGGSWHVSSVYAGPRKDKKGRFVPHCTWVDKDHTNGIKWDSIKIDLSAQNPKLNGKGENANKSYYCGSALTSKNGNAITGKPNPHTKRDTTIAKRSETFSKYVIDSAIPEHTGAARELCESETSWGADFIGPDGMYCDMETKKLSPLCKTKDVPGCIASKTAAGTATLFKKDSNMKLSQHRFFERGFEHWADFEV